MPIAALIVLLFFVAAAPTALALSLPDITISSKDLRPSTVRLCVGPLLSQTLEEWRPNINAAFLRIQKPIYGTDRAFSLTVASKVECAMLGQRSCLGEPNGTVICNEAVLARVLYSAATMAGNRLLGAVRRSATEQRATDVWMRELRAADTEEFGAIEAFGLTDALEEDASILGVRAPGEVSKLESRIRVLERAYGSRGREIAQGALTAASGIREIDAKPSALNSLSYEEALVFTSMLHVYRAGVDQALGFILGHELAHAHGGCAVNSAPLAAVESRVLQFVEMQIEAKHCCPNPPSVSEINADRCGLVALKAVNEYWQQQESLTSVLWRIHPGFQDLGNRLAIDLIGVIIVGGLGTRIHEYYFPESSLGRIDYWPKLEESKGYLYSAFRLLLITETLHLQSQSAPNGVRACGATAIRVMEGILRSQIGCEPGQMRTLRELSVLLRKLNLPVAPRVWGVFEGSLYDTGCYTPSVNK